MSQVWDFVKDAKPAPRGAGGGRAVPCRRVGESQKWAVLCHSGMLVMQFRLSVIDGWLSVLSKLPLHANPLRGGF